MRHSSPSPSCVSNLSPFSSTDHDGLTRTMFSACSMLCLQRAGQAILTELLHGVTLMYTLHHLEIIIHIAEVYVVHEQQIIKVILTAKIRFLQKFN